jgi:DNA-binding beta-propeller fold protein YncE
MNRLAGVAILPIMLLAILVFSRSAQTEGDLALPATGTIVVANLRSESLTFHDLARNRATTLVLPGPPHEMLALGGRLYVTLGRANLVAEVDPGGPGILRLLQLAGEPHGIAERDGALLVTLDKAAAVVSIDPATFTEISREPTGDTPHMVAVSPHGTFVTDSRDNTLRRLGDPPLTATTGDLPEGIAIAGNRAVTADNLSGTLSVFEAETLAPLGSIPVGAGPVRVIALDDRRVAVVTRTTPRLVVADVARLRIEKEVDLPARPDGTCLSPDGQYLGVASNAGGTVRILATGNWRGAGSIPAGDGPGACLWLSGR